MGCGSLQGRCHAWISRRPAGAAGASDEALKLSAVTVFPEYPGALVFPLETKARPTAGRCTLPAPSLAAPLGAAAQLAPAGRRALGRERAAAAPPRAAGLTCLAG